MTWLRIFTKCVLAVALAGLILLGFFFSAVLLAQWIPLRPDVIAGLLVIMAAAVAFIWWLAEFPEDDE